MQPQNAQFVGEVVEFDGQPLPQMDPGERVPVEQFGESAQPAEPSLGVDRRFGRRDVAAGDRGRRSSPPSPTSTCRPGRRRCRGRFRTPRRQVDTSQARASRRAMPWSARPWLPGCAIGWSATASSTEFRDSARVVSESDGCWPALGNARPAVADVAVQRRTDLESSRPVLGDDRRLERGDVRHVHRDESMLGH